MPRGADPATHTKLGRGGLADVEWTAQLLQLQHAAAHPGLRVTGTVPALAALAEAGLLEPSSGTRCGRRGSWPAGRATPSSWSGAGRVTSCPGRGWS
nr:hypothetical protein [Modestobacter marinus]